MWWIGRSGAPSAPIGLYTAPAIGAAAGMTSAIVGASGRAVVVTTSATSSDLATGSVDSAGSLSASTAGGAQLNLTINSGTSSVSGTVVAASGAVTSFAGLSDGVASTSRLMNLSVLSSAGAGDQVLAVGFVIAGSGSKQVLVRGIGPALAQFGVSGNLPNPILSLFNASGQLIQSNSSWGGSDALKGVFSQVGAFVLPSASSDDAVLSTLSVGATTAQVSSLTSGSGLALVEAYDADSTAPKTRFVNMSARSQVGGATQALTIGFVVTGNAPETLLIRGIGPTLAQFGVGGLLVDPRLTVFDAAGKAIAQNDDWGGGSSLADAFLKTGAFTLPTNSKDAAMIISVQPGQYTARVEGVGNAAGVALVEIYEVP